MFRKTLLAIFLIITTILSFAVLVRESTINQPRIQIEKIQTVPILQAPSNPLIEEVNKKNKLIQSLFCDDLDVRVWENGHRFRLSGSLAYQKPTGFRMEISSLFGKELDLGSNNKEFWYWSRRDRRPGLYWAIYEDFNKTRLKTPFNPMFMRSTLGLENLDLTDCKITESNKSLMVTYPRVDSMGKSIFYSVFANKEHKRIDGFLITNLQGDDLVECEIEEWANNLPSKINYIWHEEDRTMSISLKNPEVNNLKSSKIFQMPKYNPKINMADE